MRNIILFAGMLLLSTIARAQSYPLDPLTPDEMKKAVDILKTNNALSGAAYFNIINLKEPPKKEVLAWQPGTPFRREAFVSFYDYAKPGMTEAVIDLNKNTLISIKQIPNVIVMGLDPDSLAAAKILRHDPTRP